MIKWIHRMNNKWLQVYLIFNYLKFLNLIYNHHQSHLYAYIQAVMKASFSTKQQLLRLSSLLQQLNTNIDEYNTLASVTSTNAKDDEELMATLTQIRPLFDQISFNSSDVSLWGRYEKYADKYNDLIGSIPSLSGYKVDIVSLKNSLPIKTPSPPENSPSALQKPGDHHLQKKSVRFKDNIVDGVSDEPIPPYKDNPDSPISERQIFITNQQQLSNQDQRLDQLSDSVSRQHDMSLQINSETSEQMVMLDDLESGIDHTNARLIRGGRNIKRFRDALRQNSDWCTILVLIVVLVLLLVILK